MPYKNKCRKKVQNSNTSCPNTKNITILARNPEKRIGMVFNPRCGSWDCEYCWQLNRDEWRHVAMKGTVELMDRGSMLQFVTLTGRGYFTPSSSIYFFRQNWPKMRERIKYHTNQWADVTKTPFAYFLIPERHKSGKAHWHLLVATWQNRNRWWKDAAYECGFGYMADVQTIENGVHSAAYVTKYLTKTAGGIAWPKGFRRVRTSRNWPKPVDEIPDGWDYEKMPNEGVLYESIWDMHELGWQVIDKRIENEQ